MHCSLSMPRMLPIHHILLIHLMHHILLTHLITRVILRKWNSQSLLSGEIFLTGHGFRAAHIAWEALFVSVSNNARKTSAFGTWFVQGLMDKL